jgi:hypothetical protein
MDADPRPAPAPATATAALSVALFVGAVFVTVVQPLVARDRPAADFVATLTAARTLVRPGDTVLVHPPWRDDVVAALRAAAVVAAEVRITEAFAPRHGDPWPPLVVVADEGWPLPAVLAARRPTQEVVGNGVVAFRVGNDGGPSAGVVVQALDLARARVHVEMADGHRLACPWEPSRRRHLCDGLPAWMTVGEDTLVIAGRSQRCLWAHPISGGVVVVDYGVVPVPVGGLRLSLALSDAAVGNPDGAAVTATLVVGDKDRDVTVHRQRGFSDVSVEPQGPGAVPVAVRIATANDGQRHACFRLAAVGESP